MTIEQDFTARGWGPEIKHDGGPKPGFVGDGDLCTVYGKCPQGWECVKNGVPGRGWNWYAVIAFRLRADHPYYAKAHPALTDPCNRHIAVEAIVRQMGTLGIPEARARAFIEANTPKPVDPNLAIAREACAQRANSQGDARYAAQLRAGACDEHAIIQCALLALKMKDEGQ